MRIQHRWQIVVTRLNWSVRTIAWLLLGVNLASLACWAAEPVAKGTVILDAGFEVDAEATRWLGDPRYAEGCESRRSLCVETRTGGLPMVRAVLPAETVRGCTLRGSVMVKALTLGQSRVAGSTATGDRLPADLQRPHLHRRVQRHSLGAGQQCLPLLAGRDRDF